jgi:SEC-C motif domain protein
MTLCYCQSGEPLISCCKPFLDGQKSAASPEQLMRSRFTAFVSRDWPYVMRTWHPEFRPTCTLDELSAEAEESQWLNLTVMDSSQNGNNGQVEFCAWYRDHSGLHVHHERSSFIYEQSEWFYTQGVFLPTPSEFKLKPNMPCPCGSTKKYKKCCGKFL